MFIHYSRNSTWQDQIRQLRPSRVGFVGAMELRTGAKLAFIYKALNPRSIPAAGAVPRPQRGGRMPIAHAPADPK